MAHTGRVVEPQTHGFYKNVVSTTPRRNVTPFLLSADSELFQGNPGLAGLTAHAVTLMVSMTCIYDRGKKKCHLKAEVDKCIVLISTDS